MTSDEPLAINEERRLSLSDPSPEDEERMRFTLRLTIPGIGPEPPKCTISLAFQSFVQYLFMYYAASILTCMRDHDIEGEIIGGHVTTIIRTLWHRAHWIPMGALSPTLGYDESTATLWFTKEELTELLLASEAPKERTPKRVAAAGNAFTTFYWQKPFYTYMTRFHRTTAFKRWGGLEPSLHDKCHSPFELLTPTKRLYLPVLRDVWINIFDWEDANIRAQAARSSFYPYVTRAEVPEWKGNAHKDGMIFPGMPYWGVVVHGYRDELVIIGIRPNGPAQDFLTKAASQNALHQPAELAYFRPDTRYRLLNGEPLESGEIRTKDGNDEVIIHQATGEVLETHAAGTGPAHKLIRTPHLRRNHL